MRIIILVIKIWNRDGRQLKSKSLNIQKQNSFRNAASLITTIECSFLYNLTPSNLEHAKFVENTKLVNISKKPNRKLECLAERKFKPTRAFLQDK